MGRRYPTSANMEELQPKLQPVWSLQSAMYAVRAAV